MHLFLGMHETQSPEKQQMLQIIKRQSMDDNYNNYKNKTIICLYNISEA